MVRNLLLASLFLSALLAGCSDDAGTDDVVVPDVEAPATLSLAGCFEQFSVGPVPMDAAAWLPEGFEPVPFDDTGLFATEYVIGYGCEEQSGLVESTNGTFEFTGGLFVVPPMEYAVEGIPYYAIPYGFYSTNEQNAALYADWWLSGVLGDVMVGSLADAGAVAVGHALGGADGFTVHMYSTVQGEAVASEGGAVRLFGFDWENGTVAGAVDMAWSNATAREGQSVLRVEQDPASTVGGIAALFVPFGAGVSMHIGGEGYGYTMTPVELPMVGEGHEGHTAAVGFGADVRQ